MTATKPDLAKAAMDALARMGQGLMEGLARQLGVGADGAALPSVNATEALTQWQSQHAEMHMRLWASMLERRDGSQGEPVIAMPNSDRRFSAPDWGASPFHDYLRQAYLINAEYLNGLAQRLPLQDQELHKRLCFLTRQYIEALSPANFAATNPEFIRRAIETKGESITAGIVNLIADLEKGRISQSDESAFEVGRNLAMSVGGVVFENEVMQLIQYSPLTAKVRERPLLVIPPCINKFYILDLQPENSLVRYALESGMSVFLVSWRNPGPEQSHLRWDDYVGQGVLTALNVVREIARCEQPNMLGFCIGGTLAACAAAVAAARGDPPVASLTLLTTFLDFSYPGDIGIYLDEANVVSHELALGEGGLMLARELSGVFSSLRPNDLVWNYVVDNYLKGNRPQAFDLLYWNADGTNVPGPMIAYYLRNMYRENRLREPDSLSMLGVPVDLRRIDCPTYFYASREDHIVPWHSAYLGRSLVGGETRFVLGASGHIAGVINPAAKNRRSYWTEGASANEPQQWFDHAQEHRGSWWPDWMVWLQACSGKEVAAPKRLGNRKYKLIEPAPGRYVRERA